MLDRRTFLRASSGAFAALPVTAIAAPLHASTQKPLIDTLDRLSDLHPGFAYFAGLPGHLGMPFTQRMQWAATPVAQQAFADLQKHCGVACLMIGSRDTDETAHGATAMVLRAIGSTPADARHVNRHGTTIAFVVPDATWQILEPSTRTEIKTTAAHILRGAQRRDAMRASNPPHNQTQTLERISEAVVASIANHDALTRRINASYFAYLQSAAALRSKNVV